MTIKSLYDEFEEKFTPRYASYYNIQIHPKQLFSGNRTDEKLKCRAFIEKHFTDGCKKEALDLSFRKSYDDSNRVVHMTALYLLGLKLGSLFKRSVQEEFNKNVSGNTSWFDFKYTWFLTCLYHDTASCVENNIGAVDKSKFKRSPYTTPVWPDDPGLRVSFRGSNELAEHYYQYRESSRMFDHGIAGGFLLFDKLVENFKKQTAGYDLEHGPIIIDGLHWRKEHIDHFRYIADAIICHNMWTVQATDIAGVETYKKFSLEKLIIDPTSTEDQRLSQRNYPLQFMLCLLDTIEPTKRFENLSAKDVFTSISIQKLPARQIRIAWKGEMEKKSGYETWEKAICGLADWIQVDVSRQESEGDWNYVTVEFHPARHRTIRLH